MKKTIGIFSLLIISLLALLQLSKYSIISGDTTIEYIIGIIAILFFIIGYFLKKKNENTKEGTFVDTQKIASLGLSKRELEVLELIVKGMSNKEIAETLFISESTVKTHVSNLLLKLDVKRRTQAIQRAKEWQLISF